MKKNKLIKNNLICKITENGDLNAIDNSNFIDENHLKILILNNAAKIFNLQFVAIEFKPGYKNNKFDGVLFNPKKKVFIIVEFKNTRDSKVTDQVLNYLDDIRIYPHKLINTYNKMYHKNFDEKYFNLAKTEVLIIGTQFTERQSRSFVYLYRELGYRFNVMQAQNIENKYIVLTDFFSTLSQSNIKSYIDSQLFEIANNYNENIYLEISNNKDEKYFKVPNILLNSKFDINLNVSRILYFLLYSGYNYKTGCLTKDFEVSRSEIYDFYNLNYKNEFIPPSIEILKSLTINSLNKDIYTANEFKLFSNISYSLGVIKISFSEEFINSYDDVAIINLNSMVEFDCKYSFILYHLIIKQLQMSKSKTIYIEINYFKSLFNLENKYPSDANLKIKALKPSFENFKNNKDGLDFKLIGFKKINNIKNIEIRIKTI